MENHTLLTEEKHPQRTCVRILDSIARKKLQPPSQQGIVQLPFQPHLVRESKEEGQGQTNAEHLPPSTAPSRAIPGWRGSVRCWGRRLQTWLQSQWEAAAGFPRRRAAPLSLLAGKQLVARPSGASTWRSGGGKHLPGQYGGDPGHGGSRARRLWGFISRKQRS
ncbi:uncharacterized protein LOC120396366 isoform X2 [Mauremys reevesii]|uniref:uncharacterized protein LOC120396366 isoform X2 n=1 Tax=Mauremys reevesii TaxID=260615 RepID=UPI00193EDA4D|nr:uncharacterized protein LOC120396366 isoform X2 [Mauremys reevesii]